MIAAVTLLLTGCSSYQTGNTSSATEATDIGGVAGLSAGRNLGTEGGSNPGSEGIGTGGGTGLGTGANGRE